jgi:hypothetical protein
MSQNLKMERLYNLGNYSNVTFHVEFSDLVPEGKELDEELISQLQYLQMLTCERAYLQYQTLREQLHTFGSLEEALSYLEEERVNTLDNIQTKIIKK